MPLLLAFDFDGVIVDSIEPLKDVYRDFLSSFGFKGSDSEFQLLNGPSIKEVVYNLREKYGIEEPYVELLDNYKSRLKKAYLDAPLMKNAFNTLQELKEKNVDLALVTSSVRAEVESYLQKHGIKHFFKSVITGDEVRKSKPSPDIYLSIKEQFPDHTIWAIEDSYNGMMAAIDAAVKVIYFDQFSAGTNLSVKCRINSLCELKFFVEAFKRDCCVIEKANAISVNIEDGFFPHLNDQDEIKVTRIWENALEYKSLHDGQVLYYLSHSSSKENVNVKAFWAPYRYFYSRLQDRSLGTKFVPLAVSGICKSGDELILIAKRTNVTEYESQIELVPSGGINPSAQEGHFVNFKGQLIKELTEETSLESNSINSINVLGIIEDLTNNVVDLCCFLDITNNVKLKSKNSSEYKNLSWVKASNLSIKNLIPTSFGLLNIFENKDKR